MPEIKSEPKDVFSSMRQKLPARPGIYIFIDKTGQVLYIGKSVNLRNRVASYFQKNQRRLEPRIQRMVSNIAHIDFLETETELHALLLEDKMIKLKMPIYNIRQREFSNYQFLLLTKGAFPTFRINAEFNPDEHEQAFGPFKDMYFAENVLRIIQVAFKVRICQSENPTRKCFQYNINGCTGPCQGKISQADYTQIINDAIYFLNGDASKIITKLEEILQQRIATLEFEKAAEIKEYISFADAFCQRQRFIQRFRFENFIIHESESASVTHIFIKGNFCLVSGNPTIDILREYIRNFQMADNPPSEDIRFVVDRANLVYRWLNQSKNKVESYFLINDSLDLAGINQQNYR